MNVTDWHYKIKMPNLAGVAFGWLLTADRGRTTGSKDFEPSDIEGNFKMEYFIMR